MERGLAVGGEVLNGIEMITLNTGENGSRVIILIYIAILGGVALVDSADVAKAGGAVSIEEVDVVGVNAAVDNSGHHPLACIGLREGDALLDLVNAYSLPDEIHLLIDGTWQLHSLHTLDGGHTFDLCQGQCHDGDIAACLQDVYSLSPE